MMMKSVQKTEIEPEIEKNHNYEGFLLYGFELKENQTSRINGVKNWTYG